MEERIYRVYKHTFPNGKIYIGMTKHSIKDRVAIGYKHNFRMESAVKEFGWLNTKSETLEEKLTKEEACDREKYYISLFNSTDSSVGYNISHGGIDTFSGLKHTEEHKKYMSNLLKGRIFSEEHCRKLSESLKGKFVGEKSPMYGKPKSKETIEKQYQSHKHEMKPIIQKDMEGNIINVFFSMHEANRKTGVSRYCIKNCAEGKQKSSKGFIWEYKV